MYQRSYYSTAGASGSKPIINSAAFSTPGSDIPGFFRTAFWKFSAHRASISVIQDFNRQRCVEGWQEQGNKVGYAFFIISIFKFFEGAHAFMTNRVSYAPQDLQKMCKQAERDQESKKLAALMDRVKRQIAERENPALTSQRLKAAKGVSADQGLLRLPSKSVPLER